MPPRTQRESGAQTFADLLVARGVAVGGVGSGAAPPSTVELAGIDGAPLPQVIGEDVRISDNGTAELILKEIGQETSGEGSTATGAAAVADPPEGGRASGRRPHGDRRLRARPWESSDLQSAHERARSCRPALRPHVRPLDRGRDGDTRPPAREHGRRREGASEDGHAHRREGPRRVRAGDRRHRGDVRPPAERRQVDSYFPIWISLLTTLIGYPDVSGLADLGPLPPAGG